jgi:epoxyqueuosine reductase
MTPAELAQAIKNHARQLGFTQAGIAVPTPSPAALDAYAQWLKAGYQAGMTYLATPDAQQRRADPTQTLPECRSILALATPYANPAACPPPGSHTPTGKIAAYAWGDDYHETILPRLKQMVEFIEAQVGHPIPNRYYTDTGPLLERDLAQRAGLGWLGKNTCLIVPGQGSYFLLAEILLGIDLPPDPPFQSDHCGTCTRCLDACPTQAILPNRQLNANLCISYLTIENKANIPESLRPLLQNWVFGCDICQMVCPWNLRFAPPHGDPAFAPRADTPAPPIAADLCLSAQDFNRKFRNSPVRRAKRRGYQRNLATAAVNDPQRRLDALLEKIAQEHDEPLVRQHAKKRPKSG